MSDKTEKNHEYWSEIVKNHASSVESLWRRHMNWLYCELARRMLAGFRFQRFLKTDLYDEAVSPNGLLGMLPVDARMIIGMDYAEQVVRMARSNNVPNILVTDILASAFRDNSFDCVFSNSTLDHFKSHKLLEQSLREIYRVLEPGGLLLITLDNSGNPLLFLRNWLPYSVLKVLGIIPYYMGKTVNRKQLKRMLERLGFEVKDQVLMLHAMRLIALRLAARVVRLNSASKETDYLERLKPFEKMANWPTKDLTGHYVAMTAIKR